MTIIDPNPLSAERNYLCRRCRFSLTGLTPQAGRLTCPECGLTGTLEEVGEGEPPPLPSLFVMVRMMCLPTIVLTALASVIARFADGFEAGWLLAALFSAAAVVTGLAIPAGAAHDLAKNHIRKRHRPLVALRLALMGIIINIAQIPVTYGIVNLFVHE